jgi:hypothetical protein
MRNRIWHCVRELVSGNGRSPAAYKTQKMPRSGLFVFSFLGENKLQIPPSVKDDPARFSHEHKELHPFADT